ncbi:MAG: asparaginase [Burkholderiaceae bacterium]|nr:asparaginase [Microbacteriaceae bacterium]
MSPRHPLDANGVVELARLERAGLIESRHLGAAVVTGPDGVVLRELGDGGAEVYGRSSLKPFQAIAVLRSGVELDGEQLVLATASHAGTEEHVRVVREMLAEAGADEGRLQCPVDWPLDRDAAFAARVAGLGRRRITMNCSGKHASFLLACAANGWDWVEYLASRHPLQALVRETVEELTGDAVGTVGVDGCGAPVFATTLSGLARGIGRVAGAPGRETAAGTGGDMTGGGRAGERMSGDAAAARVATAVLAHPWAIDGPGRANTIVIEELGLVAKLGAEGVLVMGAPDGTGVAPKVLDGSLRATTLIGLSLLVSVGVLDRDAADAVIDQTTERVLGAGVPVGAWSAAPAVLS